MDSLFYTQGQYYKSKFGSKVQKIPLTIASTCPNRMGINGMQTCIFCDEWGSAAYPEQREQSLREQLDLKIKALGEARRAEKFLAYFQTYTSTFLGVQKLRLAFDEVLLRPEICGIILGTRPDCFSPAVFDLINEYRVRTYFSVELGVQSLFDHHLEFLRRGHKTEKSLAAISGLQQKCGVDVGVHLIFGLPNENDAELISTARTLSGLGVTSVKLHNLHVLRGTPLADLFARGEFSPVDLEEYSRRVILFLSHLSPGIFVERLSALSSHWEELIAPEWNRHKLKTRNFIIDQMHLMGARQGDCNVGPLTPNLII